MGFSDTSRAQVTQTALLATPLLLAGGQTLRNLLKYLRREERIIYIGNHFALIPSGDVW